MNRELIDLFRDTMISGWYGETRFSNVEGKNKWNCICSAMDWLTVAVDEIEFHPNIVNIGHDDEATLTVLTLIMRIALIKESIEQLHRVFYNTSEIYMKDSYEVWEAQPFGETDNEHFETIRSCFGAHPINLKSIKGEQAGRRFASWPYVGEADFSVRLYPAAVNGSYKVLHISFDKLEQYASIRYNHLNDLMLLCREQ